MSILYVKSPPKRKRNKKPERFFFGLLTTVGMGALIFSAYPFFVWQLQTLPKFTNEAEVVPVPNGQVLSEKSVLQNNVQVVKDPDGFSYFTTNYKPTAPRPDDFYLSIPKIDIEDARVVVDDIRFDNYLSLFPGTAIPGEVGNAFITGHSVLPEFDDPKNYRAIFTKLSDLEVGDEINIDIDNKKLTYVVQYSKVVDPKDTSVLYPISKAGKNLTLMTCVPPGSSLKRLIVISSLI